jgi:hypothetical protein
LARKKNDAAIARDGVPLLVSVRSTAPEASSLRGEQAEPQALQAAPQEAREA